jgi:PAS domain S-box-containing protein
MIPTTQNSLGKSLLLRIWGTLAFIILIIVLASVLIFKNQLNVFIDKEFSKSEKSLSLFEQFASDEIHLLVQDLQFFSRNPAYANYLQDDPVKYAAQIEKTLLAYGQIRNNYLAIQILDTVGREKLHLTFYETFGANSADTLSAASIAHLQDLKPKDLYFGPLTLYTENNQLILPPKPCITLGIPIVRNERVLGYIMLHYKASRLTQRLSSFELNSATKFLLANEEGMWIKGPKMYDDFSYLLTPDSPRGVNESYPEMSAGIKRNNEGSYKTDAGLSGFRKIRFDRYVTGDFKNIRGGEDYFIISALPGEVVSSQVLKLLLLLLAYAGVLVLILIPAFSLLSRRIKKAQQQLSEQSEHLSAQNKALEENQTVLEESLAKLEVITKQREEYLKRLNKRQQDLFLAQEIAQLAYYKHNTITQVSDWSENMYRVFGQRESVDFNKPGVLQKLIHPEDLPRYSNALNEAIRTKSDLNIVYRVQTAQGQTLYLQDIAQPILVNGKVKFMQGTVQNISDRIEVENALREAKEKAEKATKAKSDFLATMSHEIRTPLNAVLGMANLLKITPLSERQKDFVRTIESSGDSLLSVINDILDYSKIESNRMTFEHKWFALNNLLEESLQVVSLGADSKDLRLYYKLDREVPGTLLGDENRLRQALINFLNNAVKFTERGEVWIEVKLLEQKSSKSLLRFEVHDTGIGIAKDHQQNVFNAFEQADNSISRVYGGSGLGLSITKKLLEAMGGSIGLESTLGVGTTFFFEMRFPHKNEPTLKTGKTPVTLIGHDNNETNALRSLLAYNGVPHEFLSLSKQAAPAPQHNIVLLVSLPEVRTNVNTLAKELSGSHEVHLISGIKQKSPTLKNVNIVNRPVRLSWLSQLGATSKTEDTPALPEITANKALRILVAEDNPVNQKLIKLVFEQLGYAPDIAKNGVQAVEMAEEKTYDLIFMDIQMPEMDGLEATANLRANKKLKLQPIVVALTANAMQGQKEVYLKAGMDDYIAKPMNFSELAALLNKYGTSANGNDTSA